MTAMTVRPRGASHGEEPAWPSNMPPAAVPPRMARKVHISRRPFPDASRSWPISSGRMPYLAGLKMALCTPIPASTTRGQMPPAGLRNSAIVAAIIRPTSTAFIVMMTVRLLSRSANTPATIDVHISGSVKTTNAIVVWVCEAVSKSGPGAMAAAIWRMPSSATISFHALSLKAPQNWAMRSARNG